MSEEAAAVLCSWMHAWHGMLGVETWRPPTHTSWIETRSFQSIRIHRYVPTDEWYKMAYPTQRTKLVFDGTSFTRTMSLLYPSTIKTPILCSN